MSKTLGLALGSGGARGVAHVGFLQALEEEGLKPDYISGCSMGAVVGACYASGLTVKQMKEVILGFRTRDVIDVAPSISRMSLLRSKKIYKLLTKYLGDKKIEDLEIPFNCVATDLYNGCVHVFKEGKLAEAVQASSSIPAVFRPVKNKDGLFVDGGCLCRVPVKVVKDMGADVVVALDVLKNASEPVDDLHSILALVLRVFDIMDTHITNQTRELEEGLCDLLLEPEIKGMSQYVIKELDRAYDEGYKLGKENAQKIKELLAD